MKKAVSVLLGALAALLPVLCLAGCGAGAANGTPAERLAVCFVIGPHANAKSPNLNSTLVQDSVYAAARNEGYISVICVDGAPEAVCAESYVLAAARRGASAQKLDMDARRDTAAVLQAMRQLVPNDPEADYYGGLRLASRLLQPLEGYAIKRIVMIGSGLNTVGELNYRNNLLSASAEEVTAALRERDAIPEFEGFEVYAQQLGDVAEPQAALSPAQTKLLIEDYRCMVEAGGGTFRCDQTPASAAPDNAALPAVSSVALPPDPPAEFRPEALSGDNAMDTPLPLTEREIAFRPDSAEFLYPEKALDALRPVAEYLSQQENANLLLAGTTAGDTDSGQTLSLSLQRALKVKETLVSLGVEARRLTAVGLGSTRDPWHVYGLGEGEAAAVNRKVLLCSAASESGSAILCAAGMNKEPLH